MVVFCGMNVQIIGTAKCRDTKKCRLWFDERGMSYHFVDLAKRPLSPGELDSIAAANGWEAMLEKKGKVWKARQLEWKDYDAREELLENPLLLKTPVVREKGRAVIGYCPDEWAKMTGK